MYQRSLTVDPETIVSDWRVSFRCPVDGRYLTVGPADFSAAMVHYGPKGGNPKVSLYINVKCLCGGMHTLEVD